MASRSSLRLGLARSGGNSRTHALVYFDKESSSAVIPASKVSCVDWERGSKCVVSWNGADNQYGAIFIATGSKYYCEQLQDIFDAESDDEQMVDSYETADPVAKATTNVSTNEATTNVSMYTNEATTNDHTNEATTNDRTNEATTNVSMYTNEATTNDHTNEATTNDCTNEATTNDRMNEATTNDHTNDCTNEATTNDCTNEATTNDCTNEATTNDCTNEATTNDCTNEATTNDCTNEATTNDCTNEASMNEATTNDPTNEATINDPTNEAAPIVSSINPMTPAKVAMILTTPIKTWVTETFMHKEIPLVAEKVVIPATDISALEEKKSKVASTSKKRRRRKPLTEKNLAVEKNLINKKPKINPSTRKKVSQTEKSGIGKGKAAKAKNDDFMLEIGPIPPRKTTLPCETTDKLSVTEMLSSNDEEFNYSDLDALVMDSEEYDSSFGGKKNIVITIPEDGTRADHLSEPVHYAGGDKQVHLEEMKSSIKSVQEQLDDMLKMKEKQDIEFQKLQADVNQISRSNIQMKQTLSRILSKLINPNVKLGNAFSNPPMVEPSNHGHGLASPQEPVQLCAKSSTSPLAVSSNQELTSQQPVVKGSICRQPTEPSQRLVSQQEPVQLCDDRSTVPHVPSSNQESSQMQPMVQLSSQDSSSQYDSTVELLNKGSTSEQPVLQLFNQGRTSQQPVVKGSICQQPVKPSQKLVSQQEPVQLFEGPPSHKQLQSVNQLQVSINQQLVAQGLTCQRQPTGPSYQGSASQQELQLFNDESNGEQLVGQSPSQTSWITETDIKEIKDNSCSRKNFAKNLACILFDDETRAKSNVSGRKKRKLNPIIISYIRSVCFQCYPYDGNEEVEWKECVKAIDEGNRRLVRKKV